MALASYSPSQVVLHINGRRISNYGQSETPISVETIDEKHSLIRGMNGNAIKTTRVNNGWTLTVELLPGSSNSKYLTRLYNELVQEDYEATLVVIATGESVSLSEGVLNLTGPIGRGGTSITDDIFTLQFNIGTVTLGD